jgi:hypothetical protein
MTVQLDGGDATGQRVRLKGAVAHPKRKGHAFPGVTGSYLNRTER